MTTTQRDTDYYIDTALRLAELVAANADAVNESAIRKRGVAC